MGVWVVGGWMGEWVDGWVSGWMDGWVSELMPGWVIQQVSQWLGGWASEWVADMDGWVDGSVGDWVTGLVGGWIDGWMNGWVGGWVDGWLGGWMGGWLGGCMDGWLGEWVDGWVGTWVGEWVDGWVGEWVGGWMDGWVGEWVDGWVGERVDGWMVGWVAEWEGGWCGWMGGCGSLGEWVSDLVTRGSLADFYVWATSQRQSALARTCKTKPGVPLHHIPQLLWVPSQSRTGHRTCTTCGCTHSCRRQCSGRHAWFHSDLRRRTSWTSLAGHSVQLRTPTCSGCSLERTPLSGAFVATCLHIETWKWGVFAVWWIDSREPGRLYPAQLQHRTVAWNVLKWTSRHRVHYVKKQPSMRTDVFDSRTPNGSY